MRWCVCVCAFGSLGRGKGSGSLGRDGQPSAPIADDDDEQAGPYPLSRRKDSQYDVSSDEWLAQ